MKLQDEVQEITKGCIDKEYTTVEFITDLQQGGCQSGLVPELTYYRDTLAFYNRHKDEINQLLAETLKDLGLSSQAKLFIDWDPSDPLALEVHNQNLLAWFAFEETVYHVHGKV